MDATQQIDDSFCEEDDDTDKDKEKGGGKKQREPLAALKVFKNNYIEETEVPLYQGENVLGRDPAACSVPLLARSISGCHAVISISVFHANDRRHSGSDGMEALLWDLGSLNGTRKGRMKLTPHVRYALTEGDSVVLADLPCQYITLRNVERNPHVTTDKDKVKSPGPVAAGPGETGRRVENERKKSVPPVPIWGDKEASFQSPQNTPKQPERTLVPESDSDSDLEGEKGKQKERRKFLDSASSDLSSPTCSTFLTPANKVIPESEDESFIMPSSAVTGRLTKNNSEASSDSLKPVPLNLDSDTEDEKEDEVTGMKSEPEVNAVSPPQVDPVDPACLRLDSDTDVDIEDEEVEETKSSDISIVVAPKDSVTPAGCTVDSDTGVEEKKPFKTETVPSSGTKAVLEGKASSGFHMDSDTDVEDEDAPVMTKLETPVSIPPAGPVAEFQLDSDTDAEEEEKPTGATKVISDSDTEDEVPFKPTKGRTTENEKVPQAKTVQDNSNSDTDVEDDNVLSSSLPNKGVAAQVQPPAEKVQSEFRMDSDTDAEEEEKMEEREQKALESVEWNIQNSTPRGAGLSEEEMETQAFLSPSQPFKRPALPSPLQSSVSPGGCTQGSDDFTVAETQSFVSDAFAANGNLDETRLSVKGCRGSPFQLGLSDSSHQQPDLEEHTETADPAEEDWDLQATQLYAMKGPNAGAGQKRLDLEATQAYLASEERVEKEAQPLEEENDDRESNGVQDSDERAGRVAGCHGEMMDSHPSTADTLILVRSPKEEQTQPYALFTAQTLPLSVEKEEEEDVFSNETGPSARPCKGGQVDEEPTQPFEPKANNSVAIAETQLMVENEEEVEQSETTSTRKLCSGREVAQIEPTQPLELEENTTVAETQPVGEDEETPEEEQPDGPRRFCEGKKIAKPEPTQPLEPEENTTVAVAETQPVGEDEEAKEEKQQCGTRRTRRGKKFAKPEPTQLSELEPSTQVAIAETQPMSEGAEEREKEQRSEPTSSRRSRRRKEVEVTQPLESDVAVAETMAEEEGGQEEEQQGQPRRLNRGRRTTEAEPAQPLKLDPSTNAEEEEAQREEHQSSKRSLRGKGGEPSCRGRGRATAEKEGKKRRGRATLEEEADSKVEVDEGRKRRGRKSTRQKSKERDDKDGLELEDEKERKTQKEQVKMGMEEGEQKEPQKKDGLEKETVQRERAENQMKRRLEQKQEEEERERREKEREEENAAREIPEKERNEREQRERLENENKQREKEEKERLEMEIWEREKEEKERVKKETREREEKERLENEKREKEEKEKLKNERLEKEKREREERERLEKEKKEREEVEQRLEKERREQEEKETLEKERQEREEKEQTEKEELNKEERGLKEKEKKNKENGEGAEKEKRPGRRRAGLGRKEHEKKEDEELEDKNGQSNERTSMKKEGEPGETAKVKPSRGRRPGRKSTAPPAGTEESVSADVPSKRTRSRSNSSNSVSSEQSLLSTPDAQTRGHGRGRGRGRKPAEEKVENSRPSGRRKTVMAQSTEMEQDAGPCIHSRANSRSSERSDSSAVTQNKVKGGRGRKSMKVEKPDEEAPHEPLAAPRGRGRGAKRPDPGDGKVDAIEQAHQEKDQSNAVSVNEHSVISQTPSRGRKRSAETTLAEPPQPTSKTPRRSLASQTHKVLFTGVVDEDGEKVLVRLGGGLAKGVGDMTHLVTDKVRRTVKFLCAVARGVPIVTPDWLTKCGKAGTFLSSTEFLVKDREQERKFSFNLQEALKVASRQPLLQGYEIHVTPSVKPEPSHMKDIITCCGARQLPKMPSAHKAQTVVVSCEEDRALCKKALSLGVPVVSAEFLLTGILQQKVDLQTHALSASPPAASKPAPQGRRK